jgi:glycosyltransferase involved in cell wall biosynthesis
VVNMNRGGAETLLMNLYRNVDRSKIQFDFLTCKEGVFDSEIIEMGGKVHRIPYVTDVGHFRYIDTLEQFFENRTEYNIIHAHMDKMSGLVLRSAQKAGIPIRIAHSHSTRSEGGTAAKLYKWYAGKFLNKYATHLFTCSNEAATWLFSNKAKLAMHLKNGIDLGVFSFSEEVREQVRQELEVPKNSMVIGHVGRFAPPKNHSFLIDTFSQLVKSNPNFLLVLVGDGQLRSDITKKVEDLNLGTKVKFLGVRDDVNRLLQAFDLFLFPSIYEGLPVTLVEAQGSGLPCVISDVISQEVNMGVQLIEYCPLSDRGIWINKINECLSRNFSRMIPPYSLANKGYDIKVTARETQEFYLAQVR